MKAAQCGEGVTSGGAKWHRRRMGQRGVLVKIKGEFSNGFDFRISTDFRIWQDIGNLHKEI
jgi:hypothetical protein